MKLRYLLISLFFLIPFQVNADHIYDLNMNVFVNEDGSANVIETWDVKANGGTEWYKQYMNLENTTISDLEVYMDQQLLTEELNWDINASLEEKSGHYGIHYVESDGIELCFGKGNINRHTFTLKYKLDNFVYTTSDSQIIYFTMFPKVKADKFEININGFYSFPDTLDVWGFGYKGYAYVKNGKITMASKSKLKKDYVVLLAKFPLNTFKIDNKISKYPDFNTVLSMAKDGSFKYDYKDDSFDWTYLLIVFIIPAFIFGQYLIMYAFGFSFSMISNSIKKFFSKRMKHSHYNNKKKIKYDEVPFFREIPCNKNIYYANTLIYLNGLGYEKGNIVGAIILKWALEDKIKFVKNNNNKFSEKNGSIQFYDNIKFDIDLESKLYDKLIIASNDGLLEAKELKKYCKRNYISFTALLDKFNNDTITELQKQGDISKPISKAINVVYDMSDRIYEDSVQLIGLKKYLMEFSKIDTKEVMDVKLWKEYLMFAYLFGIADKVAKQLKNLYPKEIDNFNFDYDIATFISDVVNDGFRAMNIKENISSAALSAHEAAANSYSGGGGGYSSGGGGGGSIGGGGSMGGR